MSICFEELDEQELNIILRDLAVHENLDVKELFGLHKLDEKNKKNKKNSKKSNIISTNNKRIESVQIGRDSERLQYFDELSSVDKSTLDEIKHFKTKHGKDRMKMKLLSIAFSNSRKGHMINLYLQLLSDEYANKREIRLMKKVTKEMHKMDYKRLQFEHLSNELSPLDFYNEHVKKLDDWQINVLKNIDKGKSTLVCAPTSCGKTWLSIYPGITGKKVLFVVPTQALVYQVSSLFVKFGAKVFMISSDFTYGAITDNVVVGTPKDIEDKLPVIGKNFDIVIYDEIHNLSSPVFGNYYERLVKIFKDTQFLALSATIGSPEKLTKWFDKIVTTKVSLITYSTRFLNLQRHLFMKDHLQKIHPMSCLETDDISGKFLLNNLPMTPVDCVVLYDALYKKFGKEVEDLSVANVYKEDNKRLSLDDARNYETILKKKLISLNESNPQEVSDLLADYSISDSAMSPNINLYSLFKEIKNNQLTPCIVFQQNTSYCKEIFTTLVGYLENLEVLNYPYHYDNLEYAEECFRDSLANRDKYKKTIKFDNDFVGNKATAVEELLDKKWEELTTEFAQKWKKNYDKQCNTINKNTLTAHKIKVIQLRNLKKEYDKYSSNISLKHVDIFQKHPDFCLNTSSPMTANKIRDIRNTIRRKLKISVAYTNVFMQGLKRGIGIYTTDMPPVYNMIVQQLAQSGTLGYVIADVSLALGINMPFRSSCILGYKDSTDFEIDNYLQMIGRSGRRGMDCEGHIIYANVHWKNLMKGELGEIENTYKNVDNYSIINTLNTDFKDVSHNVYANILDRNPRDISINTHIYDSETKNILLWKLREYNNRTTHFINTLATMEMNFREEVTDLTRRRMVGYLLTIFMDDYTHDIGDTDKETDLRKYMTNILKLHKLPYDDYASLKQLKRVLFIIKDIHNVLAGDTGRYYKFSCIHLSDLFILYKNVILQSNILN
tara:strand:- start:8544 stop:11390 length:2847 start_codon:yes stop_codon:yes gene_type:complete